MVNYVYRYLNGNYIVTNNKNYNVPYLSKEALRVGEELVSDFPDSIDLKITNKCSNGCPFCHENSTPQGDSFDFEKTISILSQLPALPIEIAIGGGNVLDIVQKADPLIDWLLSRSHRIRITINYRDLLSLTDEQREFLMKFEGIGISIDKVDDTLLKIIGHEEEPDWLIERKQRLRGHIYKILNNNTEEDRREKFMSLSLVIHVIAGVLPIQDLDLLLNYGNLPILILGYKQWGRATGNSLPESITEYEQWIKQHIYRNRYSLFEGDRALNSVISFDNLSLEQLHIKDALLDEEWSKLYMGKEGHHSMYIDAVKGEFARNSTSPNRASWDNIGLIEFFKNLRNDSITN